MTAVTIEVGENLVKLLTPIVTAGAAALAAWGATRRGGAKVSAKVEEAHKELQPNGGASLRDAVDRIEHNQEDFSTRLEVLEHSGLQAADRRATAGD